jgi:nucleoside-diphosphate-sugar epimerase
VLNDAALPATVLRLPMIYGPGDPLHRWFPTIKRMEDGRRAIVMPRSVAQWRSPRGYVENVAAAIALAATHRAAAGRIYNVAESESYSEAEWSRLIGEIAGWRGKVVAVPDEKAPAASRSPGRLEQHWVADSSRIRRELGFAEPVNREEAIRRTIEWERTHPPANVDLSQFDYDAEDEVLADLRL